MISLSKFPTRTLGFAFLTLALIVLSLGGTAIAQETTGSIRGVVVDPNVAGVSGATVTAKGPTGLERTVTTDSEGAFLIPKLVPGKYNLTVTAASGFKKKVFSDVEVGVGERSLGNLALEIGNVAETVTVTSGTEELVNRDQSQISASFESRKIQDLPSNSAGGGLDTLALLIPGVAQNSGGGTNTNGTGLSVNGNRGRSNNFQIDGGDNNDLSVGGPNLFIDNQDQVQEYQVITNNFSAQYGRNLGAVVNIVTKAGTNQFHGTAFLFHRDQHVLDSLNNIERSQGLLNPNRQLTNVFGGTVGGPIIKNRAFFFFSYEGIRQPATTDALSGGFAINSADLPKLTAAYPGNPVINAIVGLNPSVLNLGTIQPRSDLSNCNATTLRLAGAPATQYALCNRDFIDFNSTTNPANAVRVEGFLIERLFGIPYTQNEWSLRGDMKVTDKDSFYVRYLYQKGVNVNNLGSTNGYSGDVPFFSKNFGGTYIRQINSKMVNEFRGVYTRLGVSFGGGCSATTLGCIPDASDIDAAQIESLSFAAVTGVTLSGNALRTTGMGGGLPQGRNTVLYDFADNLTWTRGKHSLLLGGEWKYTTAHVPFLPNYGSAFSFGAVTTAGVSPQQRIFNNAPSAVSIALGNPNVPYTEIDQYYFVQDDFRFRPNITLNLGLRYEYTGQPIDDLVDQTVTRETGPKPFWNNQLPLSARTIPRVPVDKNNFAPRVGFAWSPKFDHGFMHKLVGNDATVIRGGYAIAYDPAFYNILLNVANSAPFSISLAATSTQLSATAPVLPLANSFFGAAQRTAVQASGVLPIGQLNPKWLGQTQVASDFRSPYSQQWSFGFQRQVGRNNIFEARYVGNHGVGLFQSVLRNPFVGVTGNYVLQSGVPATAVGLPIATTPCQVNGSNTAGAAPNCLGGLFGFTRNLTVNGVATAVSFPSFASLLPAGTTGLSCVDNPATPDNEGSCNGRVRPQGAITDRENTAQSNYNALQMRFNGRFLKNSLNFGATYTYSRTIDDSSEVFAFNGEGSILPQNPFNYAGERGVSALHRPNIFALNFIYDVPYKKEQHGVLGHLLGGWQLNGTHVINSGRLYTPSQALNAARLGVGASYLSGGESLRPFSGNPNAPQTAVGISQIDASLLGRLTACNCAPTGITNLSGFLSLNDLNNGVFTPVTLSQVRFIYNGPGAAKMFGTPYGDVPRYALAGPILNQTNIGIFKNTRLFERVTLQARAELFNAFNHPNIGYGVTRNSSLPNSTLIDNAGVASGPFGDNSRIAMARRVIQFSLRLVF